MNRHVVSLFSIFAIAVACGTGGTGEIPKDGGDSGSASDSGTSSEGGAADAQHADGPREGSVLDGGTINPSATGTCGTESCAAGTFCDVYVPGVPCPPDAGDCGTYQCRPIPPNCTSCACLMTCEGSCVVSSAGFATASCYGA